MLQHQRLGSIVLECAIVAWRWVPCPAGLASCIWPPFREGLIRVLEGCGFEVVAAAGDARDVVPKIRAYHPDVVVVDIQMPPDHKDDGLRAAVEIRASDPDVGVLVLSGVVLDGRRALQRQHRRTDRGHRCRCRTAHHEHLRQARVAAVTGATSASRRRIEVPSVLTNRAARTATTVLRGSLAFRRAATRGSLSRARSSARTRWRRSVGVPSP